MAVLTASISVVAVPNAGAAGECTRVLGNSQTRNWFEGGPFESQPGIDPNEWELVYVGGKAIQDWADPTFSGYTRQPYSPSCAGAPTRVIFQGGYRNFRYASDETIANALQQVVDNIFAKWPSVVLVDLIPVVGGPAHDRCLIPGTVRYVDSTTMHPWIDRAIATVVADLDSVAGPDLLIDTCSNFTDGVGHLTQAGATFISGVMAQAYA